MESHLSGLCYFFFHIFEARIFFTYALGEQIHSGSAMLGLVQEPHGVFPIFLFFFSLTLLRKMLTVFCLSLHSIMITEEISDLPVSEMEND